MTSTDYSSITNGIGRWSLVLAPALLLASGAVLPALKGPDGDELSLAAAHPDAYYLFVLFGILGSVALIPASIELARMVAQTRPRLGAAVAVLLVVGDGLALVDWGTELVKWQMGISGIDHAAMSTLAARVDTSTGVMVPLQLSGFAFLAGMVALAVGLVRSRTAPAWASVGLPISMLINLFGFVLGSVVVLDIGAAALLVCLTTIALQGRATNAVPTDTVLAH